MGYALIRFGGLVPGQRPRTALAYIAALGTGMYQIDIVNPRTRKSKYKRPRTVHSSEVLHKFSGREFPTSAAIKKAKQSLPIVELNDSRFDIQDTVEHGS